MNFELNPFVGIEPVRLGMSRDAAGAALGLIFDKAPVPMAFLGSGGWMLQRTLPGTATFFVVCDGDKRVSVVSLGSPTTVDGRNRVDSEDVVQFRGYDVFRNPTISVVAALKRMGLQVTDTLSGNMYEVPELGLQFSRQERSRYLLGAAVTRPNRPGELY